jgi:aspartate-semialdehyde dehydrogenase
MARICVLGAHTAVAKALLECLDERGIEVEIRRATTSDHISDELEIAGEEVLRWCDLAVLTFSGPAARQLALAARSLERPVLDLAEVLSDEKSSVWIYPGIDPDAGASFDPVHASMVPIGLGAPIVGVLKALAPFRPVRAVIATFESVAALDQPGIDELSDQVRARFNMRDVEPHVFPSIIAFGSIPMVGGAGATASEGDERLRRAIERGVERELPDLDLFVMRAVIPTFSADSAVVIVDLEGDPSTEEIAKHVSQARGIHYFPPDEVPSSFDAIGRDDALAGRITVEPSRAGVWIACDRLRRGSATLGALAIERWLATRGA